MRKQINFGIGFITGRANVCKIINSYYKDMLKQVKKYNKKIKLTIFILFDTSYQNTPREEFYNLKRCVYKNIKIKYITPEDIQKETKKLILKNHLCIDDLGTFFGYGHAKGRNTVMYYAMKNKMDYLLFWDDDEYPVATYKDQGKNTWLKQKNIVQHIKFMEEENADITIGCHCGYISPIPYIDFNEKFTEEDLKGFIEVISNEIVSWETIKEKMKNNNGVTYANIDIAKGKGAYEIKSDGTAKWVAGSTLCLNLNNKDKIPAFYNPPFARGEDTFFSTLLDDTKVIRVPVYHFHDGFLKYTCIMDGKYPKCLRKIHIKEDSIKERFLKASLGWIRYKPLLLYIKNRESYKEKIKNIISKLEEIVPKLNTIFEDNCFSELLIELEKANQNVEQDYKDYEKTNEVWKKLKDIIK